MSVRPTADRVREAVFDILLHGRFAACGSPVVDAVVLDAFAGTGAFGLEALSRGAAAAVFIERDPVALAVLGRNVAALDETGRARIVSSDATHPPAAHQPATLAFLDPPYGSGLAAPALVALAKAGWLAAGALAIVEVGRRESMPPPGGFAPVDERVYGAARLVFLGCGAGGGST
jgi:16S rRNA (guanine966-N2)-methyltransferase